MIALIRFVPALLISPFKSNSRLEAENAALRLQLSVLRRNVKGRAKLNRSHCDHHAYSSELRIFYFIISKIDFLNALIL